MKEMGDPKKFGGLVRYVTIVGSQKQIHERYALVLFGTGMGATSFGVIDLKYKKLFTTAHAWKRHSAYFYRRIQPQCDYLETVLNRKQLFQDVAVSDVQDTIPNHIPIHSPLDITLRRTPYNGPQPPGLMQFTCLLDGTQYATRTVANINGSIAVLLDVTTYPGHSGLGFVDANGTLFLLSGGYGKDFTQTFLVPAIC
jgi:hypothetical protein